MSELELSPELRRVEDALRGAGPLVDAERLLAGATGAASTPARDLQGLIDLHADEALAFLEALTGDSKLAEEVLEETLAAATPPLDLADLLGQARARATRRLASSGVGKTGPLDLAVDVRALLLLRHGLGLTTTQLARAGEARPGTALLHAAEALERVVPTPTHPDSAELARLLARDVADVADAGDRARLADLALDPALAPTVERVRAALSVPVVVAPAGLRERVEARCASDGVARRVALRCTYCHDGLAAGDACHCATCLAPHHPDCFAAHGRCGVHGCGGARVVRAGLPAPRPAPPRSPWWFAAGGALGGALVTAALFLSLAPGERDGAAHPGAPPTVRPTARPTPVAPVAPPERSTTAQELRGLLTDDQPDWRSIAGVAGALERRAPTDPERADLRAIREECELQLRSEELCARAADIVNARDVARYDEALRLLARVDSGARIHPDARAYVQWIQADQDVRQAALAYAQGDERRAVDLLGRALTADALGPEARSSILTRRTTWLRVATAYRRGELLFAHVGRNPIEVRDELRRVLQLEPDPANQFHVGAKALLEKLERELPLPREELLGRALAALEQGDVERAGRDLATLAETSTVTPDELARIQDAVVALEREKRLVAQATTHFRNDREETFMAAYEAMKLLARWLPPDHPQRAAAERLRADFAEHLASPLIRGDDR
jgi:hypothetical protein